MSGTEIAKEGWRRGERYGDLWRPYVEIFNDSRHFAAELFNISHSTRENKFIVVNSTM
jgi:hypothetical protein